ncbi:putative transcription factor C3H family [Rosa chinensis]|uniref:Putative transcription factor C3H family n=1 Tax=Rosa chinensis TaxID=74649 RepID=A0A2P6R8L1_ROSCH|nr:putative transcription factor C3H family [Rosa chinensis]
MADFGGNAEPGEVCNFFRKPTTKRNFRKHTSEAEDDEESNSGSAVLPSQRKAAKTDCELFFSSGPSTSSASDNGKVILEFKYGDSCKFVHDRGDYKSGWQMEREWDETEKVRKRNLALLARKLMMMMMTRTTHHSKNKKCFVCNKPTLGIFNTAHEIRKRMAVGGK